MAFDPSGLNLMLDNIGGTNLRVYGYTTTDIASVVTAVGYFANIDDFGLDVGDVILVECRQDADATKTVSIMASVSVVDADGNASIGVADDLNVRMFGAKGDGVTRDGAAIQAALTTAGALGLGKVKLGHGRFLLDVNTALETGPVVLEGEGPGSTVLIKSGTGSAVAATGVRPDVVTDGATLSANVATGAMSVTLTGGASSFTENSIAVLVDQGRLYSGTFQERGEFVAIQDITGNTVSFWSPVELEYTTAETARLVRINFIEGAGVRNLTIEMDDTITVTSSASWQDAFGIAFRYCRGPVVENVTIKDAVHAGIFLHSCLDARIDNYRAVYFGSNTTGTSDPASADGTPGFGYGIREDGLNKGLIVTGCFFDRTRHAYTTIGGYAPDGNMFAYGWPTGTIVADCIAYDSRDSAYDTHWVGSDITFLNCVSIGARRASFQLRARRTSVIGCTGIRSIGPGVWVRGGIPASGLAGDDCRIISSVFDRTNMADDIYEIYDWRDFGCIYDEAYRTVVSDVVIRDCAGPAIHVGRSSISGGNSYRNLHVTNPCSYDSTLNPYAIYVGVAQENSNILIDGLFVRDENGNVTDLVYRADPDDPSGDPVPIFVNNVRGVGHTGRVFRAIVQDNGARVTNSGGPSYPGPIHKATLFEDFLSPSLALWSVYSGTETTDPVFFPGENGLARLDLGANATTTMAVNGASILGAKAWSVDQGGLVFEASIRLDKITNIAVFVGLTDTSSTLEMPATLGASNAITAVATDAVGFIFDTSADNDVWFGIGLKNGTNTLVSTALAPIALGFTRLRFECDVLGNTTFYVNGARAGALNLATTVSTVLAPTVAAFNRNTDADTDVDVDYIMVEQNRSLTL